MWRFLLLVIGAAVVVAGFAYADYRSFLEEPLAVPEEARTFVVKRGWSAERIAGELESNGIIAKRHWLDVYLRLSGKASAMKSGEFRLPAALTVPELVSTLVSGRSLQYSQVIVEGSTFRQLRRRLQKNDKLTQTLKGLSDEVLMRQIGAEGEHPEGRFFADTYRFPRGTTDLAFLKRAHRTMQRVLDQEWADRAPDLPIKTPYDALILASIVEKETAVVAERPLIAGVFHSRLKLGMRLQTDPTVIYGIGEAYDGDIRRSDLTTDTPYNTYTRHGLPPTPIAMVGREALHAVLHPDATTSLYFVARGDGTHQFSETLEAHNAAVRKYQLSGR